MSKRLVVDSSVLIILSRRGTLEAYLQRRKKEGYEVLIPKAIARELIDEPKKLATRSRPSSRRLPQAPLTDQG
jgi:predicted PilT family ATPase